MQKLSVNFNQNPEQEDKPFDIIKSLLNGREGKKEKGLTKIIIANKFINAGFSIENAAENSTSAKYFINKLKEISI